MDRATKIAAARRFAPPLVEVRALDPRGARLRQINPKAIRYAANAGFGVLEVYPDGLSWVRSQSPGGQGAARFARTTGIAPSVIAGEAPLSAPTRSRWRVIASLALGAAALGPVGLAIGAVVGAQWL